MAIISIRQNTVNHGLSQYINFPFSRGITSVRGIRYGLNKGKLCKLVGDADEGAPIIALIQSGSIVLNNTLSRIRSLFVYGDMADAETIEVSYAYGERDMDVESEASPMSSVGVNGDGILKFRGTRDKTGAYLAVSVKNLMGKYFLLTGLKVLPVIKNRK